MTPELVIHAITSPPYEVHTHGLKEVGKLELVLDAIDPLFIEAAVGVLQSVAAAIIGGQALSDGTVFTFGGRSIRVSAEEVDGLIRLRGAGAAGPPGYVVFPFFNQRVPHSADSLDDPSERRARAIRSPFGVWRSRLQKRIEEVLYRDDQAT